MSGSSPPRAGCATRFLYDWLPQRPLAVKRVVHREATGWWVERDNPCTGVDSWLLGAVPDADVLAVVVARLWPPSLRLPLRAAG